MTARGNVMIRRVLVALVALIAVMLADVPRTMGQTPAVCRVSCKDSKKACYGQGKGGLAARTGACAGGPPPRRKCRRQAKLAALAERSACRGFMRECHTCCAADGSECSVGCGDGTVSSERGEECDPPGASCEAGAVCDSECHCPATATTTSTTATTLVTS